MERASKIFHFDKKIKAVAGFDVIYMGLGCQTTGLNFEKFIK